jgi:hypothetical protein
VLLTGLACRRAGRGGASGAARRNSAALHPLLEPATRSCRQLERLHGMGNWRPMCRCEGARVLGWHHVRVGPGLLVLTFSYGLTFVGDGNNSCKRVSCRRRGENSSYKAETCRARQRLLVRGGDLSEKSPLSRVLVVEGSHWLEARRLASEGLDRDLKLSPVLNLGLHIVDGVRRLHLKSNCLAI